MKSNSLPAKQANLEKEIIQYCHQLKLASIKNGYMNNILSAQKDSTSYLEFLHGLLQIEIENRQIKRIEKYLKESRLPLEKSLDQFDLSRFPLKIKHQVKTLADGLFIERMENILVFGKPGTGKTHLLCAIAKEQIKRGRRIYFSTCNLLVQELLSAKRDFKLPKFIRQFGKFDAVILDDIGYVSHEHHEMEVLFTFLAERYERGSIMITSNLPFSQWEKIFKDPMTTAAAIDRLIHHAVILELNVDSFRMQNAEKNKEKK